MEVISSISSRRLMHGCKSDNDDVKLLQHFRWREAIATSYSLKRQQPVYCASSSTLPKRKVLSWGSGGQGQLGHGDHVNQSLPKAIDYLASCLSIDDSIRQCSCGSFHTGCVTEKGKVFTWGREQENCLGHGWSSQQSSNDQALPKDVASLDGYKITKISCGDTHTLALTADGRVLSWGRNNHYQCGRRNPPPPVSSASGTDYAPISSSLFKRQSRVIEDHSDPWAHRLQAAPPLPVGYVDGFPVNTKIVDVSCGKLHSIALSSDGSVYVWGSNSEGALGLGDHTPMAAAAGAARQPVDFAEPIKIDGGWFEGKRIVKIAAGFHFSAVVSEDGKLYTFGSDQYGQLGHGKESRHVTKPVQVRSLSKVREVSCGQYHMAAITETGEVYTWGFGKEGQLGHAEKSDHSIPTRVEKLADKNHSVACGGGHTAVVDKDFTLWMMGKGRDGQLGRADKVESVVADRPEPLQVPFFTSSKMKVVDVSLGQEHSLAIVTENSS